MLPANRVDAWHEHEDERLIEIVLKYIENGSTQENAFYDAGKKLGRTPAACGFRWNSILRHVNKSRIQHAKAIHKKMVMANGKIKSYITVLSERDGVIEELSFNGERYVLARDSR